MTTVRTNGQSRRDRKKSAARKRIMATAMKLFSRHGIEGVTVEHIADVADLGKGTVYNYFQTKEDIVVAYMVEKELEVQARLARLTASRGSLVSILTQFLLLQFRLKRPHHRFVRVFLAQMFLRTEQFMPSMVAMQKSIDENLSTLFRGFQSRGLLRLDLPLADVIVAFKTLHLGLTGLWAVEGPPFRYSEHVLRDQIKLFCEGLEKKSR